MSTIGTTLFSKIEINGQEVDIATLDAADGIYALPAGQTTANVKFTMIDNTSIPRGVFEENSYITAMTLPDAMTYIASYSFHGVNNINISDKNAILAINPYAFDADSTPVTDPDFYFNSNNYEVTSGMSTGMDVYLYNNTQIDTMLYPIQWTSSSADITIDQSGYVSSSIVGATGTITATISDGTNTHTATCTVSIVADKQYPTANWVDSNLNPVYNLQLVAGSASDQTLTFSATPNDSWTFYDPGIPGISVNTTTGEVTVTGASVQSAAESSISANRSEDTTYWSGMASLSIKVFPAGTDLTFYFEQSSVNLDNQAMTTQTPMLINNTSIDTTLYPIQYVSGDTNVATVDNNGTISFAGAGNTTVTATLSDGNETHTATITVYCTSSTKTVSVLSNEFVNSSGGQTTNQKFKIGNFDYGYSINTADLSITYTTNSSATISISNVSITQRTQYASITFDLTVGQGVAANDTVSIYAELTDNGSGYSMANTNAGIINLIPE